MKDQLKQFGIAALVLAAIAALFFGWQRWHYRPQTLEEILPVALDEIETCDALFWYSGNTETNSFDLTSNQLQELLERLSATQYRSPGPEDGYCQIVMDPSVHITFYSERQRFQLLLPGNLIRIDPLPGNSKTYAPEGGEEFQRDVVNFLLECAKTA